MSRVTFVPFLNRRHSYTRTRRYVMQKCERLSADSLARFMSAFISVCLHIVFRVADKYSRPTSDSILPIKQNITFYLTTTILHDSINWFHLKTSLRKHISYPVYDVYIHVFVFSRALNSEICLVNIHTYIMHKFRANARVGRRWPEVSSYLRLGRSLELSHERERKRRKIAKLRSAGKFSLRHTLLWWGMRTPTRYKITERFPKTSIVRAMRHIMRVFVVVLLFGSARRFALRYRARARRASRVGEQQTPWRRARKKNTCLECFGDDKVLLPTGSTK